MELPNHFTDEEILLAQRVPPAIDTEDDEVFVREGPRNRGAFSLTMGLLMRLNTGFFPIKLGFVIDVATGMYRVVKRSLIPAPAENNYESRFLSLISYYSKGDEIKALLQHWKLDSLLHHSNALSKKASNLSHELMREFDYHPVLPPGRDGGFSFHPEFLAEVAAYHRTLSRPDDVFVGKASDDVELTMLRDLAGLDREECPRCHGRRQIYCGNCGGIRLA